MVKKEAKLRKKHNRIFILGTTGSGKSTLARLIAEKTKLTHYSLDWIVYSDHNSWNKKYNEKTRDKKLQELIKKKKWIIEGAYVDNWILPIIKKADLVIILQLPRHVLMKRVVSRYVKNKLARKKDRFKDMLNLIRYSYKYEKNNFFVHKEMVEKNKKEYIILKSVKEIQNFLKLI